MSDVVKFSTLGITPDVIIGDKISINNILNVYIIIYKIKIDKSKFSDRNKSGLCMQMQIKVKGEDEFKTCFTGSNTLINMMNEALDKRENIFPLEVMIVRSGKMLVFT